MKKWIAIMITITASLSMAVAQEQWKPITPGGGGVFTTAQIHPDNSDLIYLASDVAGVMRSDNEGESWWCISEGLGDIYVQAMEFDPFNSNGLYITTSDGIYHSPDTTLAFNWRRIAGSDGKSAGRDPGIHWKKEAGMLSAIRVVSNGVNQVVIYAGTGNIHHNEKGTELIWVCTDGTNWNSYSYPETDDEGIKTDETVYSICVQKTLPNVVWISTGDGIYRSADYGQTWTDKTGGLPHRNARTLQTRSWRTHESVVVLADDDASGLNGGVYYRNPSSGVWEARTNSLPVSDASFWKLVARDSAFPNLMYVGSDNRGGSNGVYKTTNGGADWELITTTTNITTGWFKVGVRSWMLEMSPSNSGSTVFVGGDGRLLKSSNGGDTFVDTTTISTNILAPRTVSTLLEPGISLPESYNYQLAEGYWKGAGQTDNMVVRQVTVDPNNSSNIFLSCADQVLFRSQDGGDFWRRIDFQMAGVWCGGAFDVTFHPSQSNTLFALVSKGYGPTQGEGMIVKSTDGGDTWTLLAGTTNQVGNLPGNPGHDLVIAQEPYYTNGSPAIYTMYVSLYGAGVYASSDNGLSWSLIGLEGMNPRELATHPEVGHEYLLVGVNGTATTTGLWLLEKGTNGWSETQTTITNEAIMEIQWQEVYSGKCYVTTSANIYRSYNDGINWHSLDLPTASSNGTSAANIDGLCTRSSNRVYISQYGHDAGIWRSATSGNSWTKITRQHPNPRALELTLVDDGTDRVLYSATQGNGAWRLKLKNNE